VLINSCVDGIYVKIGNNIKHNWLSKVKFVLRFFTRMLSMRCMTCLYGNDETATEQVYETLDITSESTRLVARKFCITTQNCLFVEWILQISEVLSFYWYLAVSSLVRGFRCCIFKENNKGVEWKYRKFSSKVAAEYWWMLNLMKVLKSKDSSLLGCCTVSTAKWFPTFRSLTLILKPLDAWIFNIITMRTSVPHIKTCWK
jgi:hypothetical protein